MPATERLLCRFVTFLTKEGLKLRTIKVYLSAVRFLHIEEAGTDPFLPTQPRLHYILQGIKRAEAEKAVMSEFAIDCPLGIWDVRMSYEKSWNPVGVH